MNALQTTRGPGKEGTGDIDLLPLPRQGEPWLEATSPKRLMTKTESTTPFRS